MSDLLDAQDHQRFLRDACDRAGLANQDLAAAVGRSKSWLSLMLAGQRPLDPSLVPALCDALALSEEERLHLEALVDLHAPSERAQRAARATLQAHWAHRAAAALEDTIAEALSRWWVLATIELAECEGFRPEAEWIANTLVPRISVDQAQEALDTLIEVGLLAPDADGTLVPQRDAPTWAPTTHPAGRLSQASRLAQRDWFRIAADNLDRFHENERHSAMITFSLSEEQLGRVRSKLRELERELVLIAHEEGESPNRVYNLATQLMPLSDYTDWEPPDEG
jgi:uncharacterized protein (TIGR02147 family)